MASFFSAIRNHKKTVFLAVLVFVLGGFFVPKSASAVESLESVIPKRVFVNRPTSTFPIGYSGNLQTFTINGLFFTPQTSIWARYQFDDVLPIYDWSEWHNPQRIGSKVYDFGLPIKEYTVKISQTTYINNLQVTVNLEPTFAMYATNWNVSFPRRIQIIACPFGVLPPAGRKNPGSFNEVLPNSKDDAGGTWFPIAGCSNTLVINVEDPSSFTGIFYGISNAMDRVTDFFTEFSAHWSLSWDEFFTFLLVEITNFFSGACYYIAYYASEIFRYILSELIQDPDNRWSITKGIGISAVLLSAWDTVKSYANILIVLALVAAATMLILQIREWADKAKALLPKIIITALLINFSVVFVGITIDASNLVIRTLTVGGEKEIGLVLKVNNAWNNIVRPLRHPIDFNQAIQYFTISSVFNILYLMIAAAFIYFSFMVVQRYLALAFLFIVSPIVFVFRVLPSGEANKIWGEWWHNFIKYCFILIPAAFFLRLSVDILNNPALIWTADRPEHLMRILANFAVVIGFLAIGLRMASKNSGPIAKAAIGIATQVASAIVTGGASLTASGIGKMGGTYLKDKSKDAFNWTKDKFTQTREYLGGLPPGRTALNQKLRDEDKLKKVNEDDRLKRVEAMSADQRVDELRVGRSGKDAAFDRSQIIQQMAKDGQLGRLTAAELEQFVGEANRNGVKPRNIEESDYRASEFNQKKIDEYINNNLGGVKNPANIATARQEVRLEQLERRISSMKENVKQQIPISDLTINVVVTSGAFTPNIIRDFQSAPAGTRAHLKTLITIAGGIDNQITDAVTAGDTTEERRLNNLKTAITRLP